MEQVGYILCFHSQNIAGHEFENNDHAALDRSISVLQSKRVPILPLRTIVEILGGGRLPKKYAAITFDDGPDYDWLDVVHPTYGLQPSMGAILRKHSPRWMSLWHHRVSATSFVIASPSARTDIAGPALKNPDRMSESWWREAHESRFLDIGNHGWDHVHPSVREMVGRTQLVEAFHNVSTADEAGRQVDNAYEYIQQRAGRGSGRLFAYPYGQVSNYLADDYFPRQSKIVAAFTTAGEPLMSGKDMFRLPRFVCGWHFKSVSDLERLIA